MNVEEAKGLVTTAYKLLLNRDPEPAGLRHWVAMLTGGTSKADFLRAMISSAEFRSTGEPLPADTLAGVDLLIPLADGQLLRAPATDNSLVPALLKNRVWEPHVLGYMRAQLTTAALFCDIGANIGFFTVSLSPYVRNVVAFEPIPTALRYCHQNVELNKLANVRIHDSALWSEPTTLRLAVDESSLMGSHIDPDGTMAIDCITLDSLNISPTLIKMDIEGAELHALRGMRETLRRCSPQVVMEVNRPALAKLGTSLSDLWIFLKSINYQIYTFEWNSPDLDYVPTVVELESRCPPDSLIDVVIKPSR